MGFVDCHDAAHLTLLCLRLISPRCLWLRHVVFPYVAFVKVIAHLIGLEMTGNPNITVKEATGRALTR